MCLLMAAAGLFDHSVNVYWLLGTCVMFHLHHQIQINLEILSYCPCILPANHTWFRYFQVNVLFWTIFIAAPVLNVTRMLSVIQVRIQQVLQGWTLGDDPPKFLGGQNTTVSVSHQVATKANAIPPRENYTERSKDTLAFIVVIDKQTSRRCALWNPLTL